MGILPLGQQGYSPIEILGSYLATVTACTLIQQNRLLASLASWLISDLTVGSSVDKVRQLQEQLDAIAQVYT